MGVAVLSAPKITFVMLTINLKGGQGLLVNFVKLPVECASSSISCDRELLPSMFSMSRILVLSSFTIFGCSALKVLNLESAEGNLFELQYEV